MSRIALLRQANELLDEAIAAETQALAIWPLYQAAVQAEADAVAEALWEQGSEHMNEALSSFRQACYLEASAFDPMWQHQ